jgi:hypothetical protein
MAYKLKTYYKKENLPPVEDVNFFHYASSFDLYEKMPCYRPLMIVAFDEEKPVACMFALIKRLHRFLFGPLFKKCYVSQKPSFFSDDIPQEEIFHQLVEMLLHEVRYKVFFIQFRNLDDPIFGYKAFRDHGFYSIKWISIKNSLQRKRKIWAQLSSSRKNQVNKAKRKGVIVEELSSEDELPEVYRCIKKETRCRTFGYSPSYQYLTNFYRNYVRQNKGKIFVAKYGQKTIGGIILGFEKSTVYCLYYWGKKKEYKKMYPSIYSIWWALQFAENEGYLYFDFMDAGRIHEKKGKPLFLLQFGGKQRATRRWNRFTFSLINLIANWIYD